jgi:hypothetical protein
MKLADLTSFGRPIDPSYPTNRAIALLGIAVGGAGTIVRLLGGSSLTQSVAWGAGAAFAVFFAWALGRELDPDHDLSSFVAAGLLLISLFFFELPALLVLLWMLLVLRIVNRTTGLPATPLDSLAALGLGGWLAWQETWVYGLMTALAFAADALLRPQLRRQIVFAALVLIPTVAALLLGGPIDRAWSWPLPGSVTGLAGVTSVLFVLLILDTRHVVAVCDSAGQPLRPVRVQAAQVLALLTALLVAWWDGGQGIVSFLPLWAAMLGVAVYRVFVTGGRFLPGRRGESQE